MADLIDRFLAAKRGESLIVAASPIANGSSTGAILDQRSRYAADSVRIIKNRRQAGEIDV
jgi:hypothetical protein